MKVSSDPQVLLDVFPMFPPLYHSTYHFVGYVYKVAFTGAPGWLSC